MKEKKEFDIKKFKGLTIKDILVDNKSVKVTQPEKYSKSIRFILEDDRNILMYHKNDLSEVVYLEDIVGDLIDLIDSEILMAEESTNYYERSKYDTCTWTFYKFATRNGYVTIRWYGTSNGFYSEKITIIED